MRLKRIVLGMLIGIISSTSVVAADSTRVATNYGILEVKNGENGRPDSLILNGKLVYRAADSYLHIKNVFQAQARDIVVLTENCGGSACSDLFLIASIKSRSKVKVLWDEMLFQDYGPPKISFDGEAVRFDFGYQDGKRKRAIFRDGQLTIIYVKEKVANSLPKDDCDYIYDLLQNECVGFKKSDPTCSAPASNLSMHALRSVNAISHHPAFRSEQFNTLCLAACKSAQVPLLIGFKKNFCSAS